MTTETRLKAVSFRSGDGVAIALREEGQVPGDGRLDILIGADVDAQTLRVLVGGEVVYQRPAAGQ